MYISFDYKCRVCDTITPRFVKKEVMDNQHCAEGKCFDFATKLIRLPAGTRTTFRHADTKLKA